MVREESDTDREANADTKGIDIVGFDNDAEQAIGQDCRGFSRLDVLGDDAEFVAAHACNGVAIADSRYQAGGNGL